MSKVRSCRRCGCTDFDCRRCIQKTGRPCHWVELDLCSACTPTFENIAAELHAFATEAFPKATAHSCMMKLKDETIEVMHALLNYKQKNRILEEYADCFLVLMHSVMLNGYTVADVLTAMDKKVQKNKTRKWQLDETGNTYSHIKEKK